MAGLASARARGRKGGSPKPLDEGQVRVAIPLAGFVIALAEAGELPIKAICEQVGCSRSTYYRQVAPRLKAPASAAPLQLDQSVYVALCAAATAKPKPESKLSYVCKKQAGKGGIVHAVKGEVGPGNWRQAALCGAKPSASKCWELLELVDVSCAKCRRKLG
ncbi:MAG: helix-turn-helix domain-containing protein [Phormidesmis sp.]